MLRRVGQQLLEDVDGRDGEFPVGDPKVSQVGSGVAGETRSRVETGPAEFASHQAESTRVEVCNCGKEDRESVTSPDQASEGGLGGVYGTQRQPRATSCAATATVSG